MGNRANKGEALLNPSGWLDQYGDDLFRYALSRLRDVESAEEVVQETFVAALRSRDQYSGTGTEKAWLIGILKRKVVDFVRKRNRAASAHSGDVEEDLSEALFDNKGKWRVDPRIFGDSPESAMESQEFLAAFRSCLSHLPPRQADAFTSREIDGKKSDEICKELAVSASNLWVLLHRARLALSRCLQSNWREQGSR